MWIRHMKEMEYKTLWHNMEFLFFFLKRSKDHVIVQLGIELTLEFHQITVVPSPTAWKGHTNVRATSMW